MAVSIAEASRVTPSGRQLAWQKMEFYAFIHFTVNTFTDSEWGTGLESPSLFDPSGLDAAQWVEACRSAGMTGIILTCKHHDGFCLWPSKYTEHTVASSPWRNGGGDLVREVSEACREAGLKFGVYLSPWDRHEPCYGDSERYNAFFVNQLTELLTGYGELFCVWFDGACGEGPNGKRQVYDWEACYAAIRRWQPGAVISVCGPDVRWCGNEGGHTRRNEWSVVPATMRDNETIQSESQQADDSEFRSRIASGEEDLGSRAVLETAESVVWYPAEVNTSIRPGWFYHAEEDERVKSLGELADLYERAVGGNAALLLNLPPDRRGLIHENDARRMRELGEWIRNRYAEDKALAAVAAASIAMDEEHGAHRIADGREDTYWRAPAGREEAVLELDFGSAQSFDRVVLMEWIQEGQRIERFYLERFDGREWHSFYEGGIVGYKKICRFAPIHTGKLRLVIAQSRWYPTLMRIGVYGPGASGEQITV